jgi:hypothetical protein
VLDKIINDDNNANQIQATSGDVYMSWGHPVATTETLLRSVTLVIDVYPTQVKAMTSRRAYRFVQGTLHSLT